MTGQQRTSEIQALEKRHIVDNYITPLPFFPKRDTPVKEQNTGAMSRSSPVHGVHRVVMKVDDTETWLCIGDSVIYRVNAGEEPRVGRVVEIYLCEEFETTGVAIRRYMMEAEILHHQPAFGEDESFEQRMYESQEGDLWEVDAVDRIYLENIERSVAVCFQSEHGCASQWRVVGTVDCRGTWQCPFTRCLMQWEDPWIAQHGFRTDVANCLIGPAEEDRPKFVVNMSISQWSDDYQTFNRGTVSSTYCTLQTIFNMNMY